ncbi:hypothetical protein HMPREF2651_05930 [Corynebacterium sp. HMSC063A05]|uniref:hypothetical protein n=1 Tax=Corynebacterium amycolatum TaxID=43765 RepID=UPI000665229A|nr:hypothetical protein [Corynebacterium amycolatum]OFM85267.1 hypothetical protein HMPREF2651_05930 [Corynebacterium sp. HMSC063A05]
MNLEGLSFPLNVFQVVGLVGIIFLLVIIAERMAPLRSVDRDRWEWEYRPARRFPGIDRDGWLQVLVFTVFGFGIGGVFRYVLGVARPRRLATVLSNGVTQSMTRVTLMFFNAELASNIYAASWLRNATIKERPFVRTSLPALMLRRLVRRGYIPLLFVAVALAEFSVVPLIGNGGRTLVLLCWAVLASAVWRATRLEAPGQLPWRVAILSVVTVLGMAVQFLPGMPLNPMYSMLWAAVAIVYCALVRGKPRETNDFSSIEIGLGAPLEMGKLGYWFSGSLAIIPAIASELMAIAPIM